ncbi:MAG: hypothetical protein AAB733_03260 [Patescibacteria group bacterium]
MEPVFWILIALAVIVIVMTAFKVLLALFMMPWWGMLLALLALAVSLTVVGLRWMRKPMG